MKNVKTSETLAALLAVSLSLPGLAQASDQGYRSDKTKLTYLKAQYGESDERMDVDIDHLSLSVPFLDSFTVQVDAIKDVTSGASPVNNFLDSKNQPVQVLESGASIKDQRDVLELSLSSYQERFNSALKIGHSKEDDYRSRYINADISVPFRDKTTTLKTGIAYSKDDVWNSYDPAVLLNHNTRYYKRKKIDFLVGVEQILDKNSFVSMSLKSSHASGFLSDPYKKVLANDEGFISFPVDAISLFSESDFANNNGIGQILNMFLQDSHIEDLDSALEFVNESGLGLFVNNFLDASPNLNIENLLKLAGVYFDSRPDTRDQLALALSYSRYLEPMDAGLHLDYRYSNDDWGANSHTLEAKFKKDLGHGWMVAPQLRYYSQDSASFYNMTFDKLPSNGIASSDYRLASFASLTPKIEVSKQVNEHLNIQVNYEHYQRRFDWALDQGVGHDIDDFSYDLIALSLQYEF